MEAIQPTDVCQAKIVIKFTSSLVMFLCKKASNSCLNKKIRIGTLPLESHRTSVCKSNSVNDASIFPQTKTMSLLTVHQPE